MRTAQLLSAAIYLLFIGLATVLFHDGMGADVTAIISMTKPVAVVLPLLLSVAAIGSQFSAAVADAEGAGGLIEDISQRRVSIRLAYLIIMIVALSLTWATDVNTIISYASRAFALYYFLQCLVAILTNWTKDVKNDPLRQLLFIITAIACLTVFVFGLPSG